MGIFEKLRWAWKLLRSRAYVVVLDRDAGVFIPLFDVESFENQFLLASQRRALEEIKTRLEGVIKEHDVAAELLSHRKNGGVAEKGQAKDANKVRKASKKSPKVNKSQ